MFSAWCYMWKTYLALETVEGDKSYIPLQRWSLDVHTITSMYANVILHNIKEANNIGSWACAIEKVYENLMKRIL